MQLRAQHNISVVFTAAAVLALCTFFLYLYEYLADSHTPAELSGCEVAENLEVHFVW